MKKQRILCLVLALCMVLTMLPFAALAVNVDDFVDVKSGSWYYEDVEFVTSKGYFVGTSATQFQPAKTMNRAMFALVLARLDGAKLDNSVSTFDDVPVNVWYTGAVTWANEKGFVLGYGDGNFGPADPITREDMCLIMDRYINYYSAKTGMVHEKNGTAAPFGDAAQIRDYAKQAVENCRDYGLVLGFTDGNFYPRDNSSRAQVAAVIHRLAWMVKPVVVDPPVPPVTHTTYTLTYDANGGVFADGAATKSVEQVDDNAFTIISGTEEPTYEGYVLLGWGIASDGAALFKAGNVITTGPELTLYAVWLAEDDYIGNAVRNTMIQVNEKYLDGAAIDVNGMAGGLVYPVNFSKDTTDEKGNVRPQSVSSYLYVTDDVVAKIIETAAEAAAAIIPDLTLAQVKEVVKGVVDALKDADISQDTVNEIANSVYDKVVAEGKSLWANFRDAEGKYYTDDVIVTVAGKDYVANVDQASGATTYSGSKRDAAKQIAIDLAKEMYAGLKETTEWSSGVALSGTVTFTFTDNEYYGASTVKYPHVYPVTVTLDLDGGDLVQYMYDGAHSCLKLRVTGDIQTAYTAALEEVIAAALRNDEVKGELESRVESALSANSVIDSLKGTLGSEEFNALLTAAVEKWVGANVATEPTDGAGCYLPYEFFWTNQGTIAYDEATDAYTLMIGGEAAPKQVLGDNTELYSLIVDLCDKLADEVIEKARTTRVAAIDNKTVPELAGYVIEKTRTTEINGYTVVNLADGIIAEAREALAAEYGDAWATMPVDEQNSFLYSSIKLTINGGDYENVPENVRNYLINLCGNKLDMGDSYAKYTVDGLVYEVIKAAMASEDYADVPASLRGYLEKLCGVELGFEDAAAYTENGLIYEAIIVALASDEYKDIPAAARSYLQNVCGKKLGQVEDIDAAVTAEVNSMIDQLVCKTFAGYDRYLEMAVKAKELETLADVQLGNLGTLLNNATFQSFVNNRVGQGTSVVNALKKIIDKLPAGASVTLNDVTLSAATLDGVKEADTLAEVCAALAGIINTDGLRTLKVSDFDNMPITVRYNSRTFTFNLTVEIEKTAE